MLSANLQFSVAMTVMQWSCLTSSIDQMEDGTLPKCVEIVLAEFAAFALQLLEFSELPLL